MREPCQHIVVGRKMQAGTAYMERHNHMAGIVCRNICAEYRLEVSESKCELPPKVVENDWAKILWDFQIQTDKQVRTNQLDIVVVDKLQKKAAVIDAEEEGYKKLEKY